MSWRTPCVDNPEAWTSDKPQERWDALQGCLTCPRLAACAKEAADDPDDRIGVRGGTDWTVTKRGDSLAPVTCHNVRCGRTILQHASGGRRRFCNEKCRTVARNETAA